MKTTKVRVTVNSGDFKGMKGIITGYDRDKYYEVMFDDNTHYYFKGHYLDGIENLKGNSRYLLQYPYNNRTLNHKELSQDRKYHVNRGRGVHERFREFHIYFEGNLDNESDEEHYANLNFSELKSKVRYAMQKDMSFCIGITISGKSRTTSQPLVAYSGDITTFDKGNSKYLGTFKRGLIKEINRYYQGS